MKVYYFTENYLDWVVKRSYWEQILADGYFDRGDKIVDWANRYYRPNDGLPRSPLWIDLNVSNSCDVKVAGVGFILSESLANKCKNLGSTAEFLEVKFDRVFDIGLSGGVSPRLRSNATDKEINREISKAKISNLEKLPRFFEMILPLASPANSEKRNDCVHVSGELRKGRTVNLESEVDALISNQDLNNFQAAYFGGAGVICTQEFGDMLINSNCGDRFVLEELHVARENCA